MRHRASLARSALRCLAGRFSGPARRSHTLPSLAPLASVRGSPVPTACANTLRPPSADRPHRADSKRAGSAGSTGLRVDLELAREETIRKTPHRTRPAPAERSPSPRRAARPGRRGSRHPGPRTQPGQHRVGSNPRRKTAKTAGLARRVTELEDGLAAARTSPRQVIRSQSKDARRPAISAVCGCPVWVSTRIRVVESTSGCDAAVVALPTGGVGWPVGWWGPSGGEACRALCPGFPSSGSFPAVRCSPERVRITAVDSGFSVLRTCRMCRRCGMEWWPSRTTRLRRCVREGPGVYEKGRVCGVGVSGAGSAGRPGGGSRAGRGRRRGRLSSSRSACAWSGRGPGVSAGPAVWSRR